MDNNESINSNLSEIFSEAGKKYGFTDVSAEYTPFAEFKVRWQRSYKTAAVTMNVVGISDIFKTMDVPDNVFDYVLYSQIVRIDRDPETTSLGSDTEEPATGYPGLQEAQAWLLKAVKTDA